MKPIDMLYIVSPLLTSDLSVDDATSKETCEDMLNEEGVVRGRLMIGEQQEKSSYDDRFCLFDSADVLFSTYSESELYAESSRLDDEGVGHNIVENAYEYE